MYLIRYASEILWGGRYIVTRKIILRNVKIPKRKLNVRTLIPEKQNLGNDNKCKIPEYYVTSEHNVREYVIPYCKNSDCKVFERDIPDLNSRF